MGVVVITIASAVGSFIRQQLESVCCNGSGDVRYGVEDEQEEELSWTPRPLQTEGLDDERAAGSASQEGSTPVRPGLVRQQTSARLTRTHSTFRRQRTQTLTNAERRKRWKKILAMRGLAAYNKGRVRKTPKPKKSDLAMLVQTSHIKQDLSPIRKTRSPVHAFGFPTHKNDQHGSSRPVNKFQAALKTNKFQAAIAVKHALSASEREQLPSPPKGEYRIRSRRTTVSPEPQATTSPSKNESPLAKAKGAGFRRFPLPTKPAVVSTASKLANLAPMALRTRRTTTAVVAPAAMSPAESPAYEVPTPSWDPPEQTPSWDEDAGAAPAPAPNPSLDEA